MRWATVRIGELAGRTGVSVRSLRYYEEQEMVLPIRTPGGQRDYAEQDVERVDLIQRLFHAGLSSKDVVQLLPCVYSGTTTPAMVERLNTERDRIAREITELSATRRRLDQVILEATARLES